MNQRQNPTSRGKSLQGDRRNPYDFTGCLAHAELTERDSDGSVTRVVGILEHNEPCMQSAMRRTPSVPLHPHVYDVALSQLQSGARYAFPLLLYSNLAYINYSIAAVHSRNLEMLSSGAYRGMYQDVLNVRYIFRASDGPQLYRLFNKSYGVDTSVPPADNLHHWLDPSSTSFRPELHDAIFYYVGRAHKDERLKVCISTKDMDEAAWNFAHGRQFFV